MRKIAFLLLLPLLAQTLIAEDTEDMDENPAETEAADGVSASSELLLQISSLPEAKLGFTEYFVFPCLQGESPLTEGNNINLALTAQISPVSLNGIVGAVWTPIAFFQLAAGGRIGTGWTIELFGSEAYGIGLNRADADGKAEQNGSAFDGMYWKVQAGVTLQADLAAVFPCDWHHVVMRSYHEINHEGYTRAAPHESWYFENDDGENCNGFNYYGNVLLGYQMPIFLNLAALLAEADLYLYDTPDRGNWGDDKVRWTFSGVFNFSVIKQLDLTLITQFITHRNFKESDWQDLYYRNRTIDSSQPLHLQFYRVAVAATYRL